MNILLGIWKAHPYISFRNHLLQKKLSHEKKHKNDHRIFFWKIVIFECEKYHWGKKYHCTHTCIRRTQKDERKGNRDKSFSAKRAIKARKIISQANFSYFIAHCCKHQTARPSLEKHWPNSENVTKVKMGKHYHPSPGCDLANVEKTHVVEVSQRLYKCPPRISFMKSRAGQPEAIWN